jgi:hypothetical protein
VITSRSHPRFLGHKGMLGPDGEPLVDGRPWNSPEVAATVVDIVGPGAKLVRYDMETLQTAGPARVSSIGLYQCSWGTI